MSKSLSYVAGLVLLVLLLGVGALVANRLLTGTASEQGEREDRPAPVAVAPVERGAIERRRVFSGSLEASSRMMVAPRVAGRITSLPVDLADTVEPGQVLVELDRDEFVQAVNQAEAELAVAEANLAEARSATEIADRELARMRTLRERGVASEAQFDAAASEQLARSAAVQVAEAQVTRAAAALQSARIRLGYTTIEADWADAGEQDLRVVAERMVEQGDTVSANTPLLSIIDLDPIRAVMYVTEREYALIEPDQPVTIRTDAYPDQTWPGRIDRIAPQFRAGSRQARIEVRIDNPEHQLKPGMFVRAEAVLDRAQDAMIVPVAALTTRGGRQAVFVVEPDDTVTMRPVTVGIRDGDRVQITGEGVTGRVVTLGQQLIDDGGRIVIPDDDANQPDDQNDNDDNGTAAGSDG